MNFRVLVLLAGAALLSYTFLGARASSSSAILAPARADPQTRAPAEGDADEGALADFVTLAHDVVTVDEWKEAPAASGAPPRRSRPLAVRALRAGQPAGSPRLVSRAARVLLGDGRHRPEPFPRPVK